MQAKAKFLSEYEMKRKRTMKQNAQHLKYLDLTGNRLTTLPLQIGDLTALEDLILVENLLTSVPDTLPRMCSLTAISISANGLRCLHPDLCECLHARVDMCIHTHVYTPT